MYGVGLPQDLPRPGGRGLPTWLALCDAKDEPKVSGPVLDGLVVGFGRLGLPLCLAAPGLARHVH